MNSKVMYIDTCILSLMDESTIFLTVIEKEKKRRKVKCVSRTSYHFFLCELKWHHALKNFIEHLLCIRRESKATYTSCAKK
jgi:hypothetical protein